MQRIINTGLQTLTIAFATPTGNAQFFLRPKQSIVVPDSYTSKVLETFVRKRVVTIINESDDVAPTPLEAPKNIETTSPQKVKFNFPRSKR